MEILAGIFEPQVIYFEQKEAHVYFSSSFSWSVAKTAFSH